MYLQISIVPLIPASPRNPSRFYKVVGLAPGTWAISILILQRFRIQSIEHICLYFLRNMLG